jgi:hypothetical protein
MMSNQRSKDCHWPGTDEFTHISTTGHVRPVSESNTWNMAAHWPDPLSAQSPPFSGNHKDDIVSIYTNQTIGAPMSLPVVCTTSPHLVSNDLFSQPVGELRSVSFENVNFTAVLGKPRPQILGYQKPSASAEAVLSNGNSSVLGGVRIKSVASNPGTASSRKSRGRRRAKGKSFRQDALVRDDVC